MALSVFWIKIIALATMVIDHIGLFFYPQAVVLRLIGRISFPLFAWLIANGSLHTRNIDVYLGRLLGFAVLSQPFYVLARQTMYPLYCGLNPLFTLFLGLLAVKGFVLAKNKKTKTAAVAICCMAAQFLNADYGMLGVMTVVILRIFYGNIKRAAVFLVGLYAFSFVVALLAPFGLKNIGIDNAMEFIALAALFLVAVYNGKQGLKLQYLFYLFYPLQFVAVVAIKAIVR